jgi:aryl-phospho-beta-D-glucosidase BglC (GH1 family)
MKRIMFMKTMLVALMIIGCQSAQSDDFETATEAVANMRVGWNLGNTLDSNSGDASNMWIEAWTRRRPADYETAWGQPVTKPELMKMFKEAGFNAIRVPVTWYPHMEAKFNLSGTAWDMASDDIGTTIQEDWMKRVHEVVDYVISQGMYCILNVHHDTGAASTAWLVASEDDYAKQKERFEEVWRQIAEEFKDYGEHLLFEGYNEMLDTYDSWCFASFAAPGNYNNTVATSAYKAINSYAQSFVDAVRATGGNNARRNLIVSTYGACCGSGTWNSHLADPLKKMKLPADSVSNHLIFEVHSYLDVKDLSSVKSEVNQMISSLKTNLVSKGAPVIFGEWGTTTENAYTNYRSNMLAFARYFVERAKTNNICTFYWMGLSDGEHRSVPEFNEADLKDAIIKGYYGDEGYQGINHVEANPSLPTAYYNLSGHKFQTPQRGLNIIHTADGKVRKSVN